MPRIGAEPERRQALIQAAINMIGEQGSLDVSVKDIAKHAGMSSSLAFHYFGGKDEIVLETMRHLLRELSSEMIAALKNAENPTQRLDAIIDASFARNQFDRNTVAAWLVFYLKAYSSPKARRLLYIYTERLRSNLVSSLVPLCDHKQAKQIAEGLGALIDGIYIRHALRVDGPDVDEAIETCRNYINAVLNQMNSNVRH